MIGSMSVRLHLALLFAFTIMQAGTLTPDERALATYIDAHNAEALALLERVVNINSGTQNFAGVREVGRVFRAELDALGFTTRWVDGAPFKRAGHLVAEHPGSGPKILLIGHLDTVFEQDSPFQKFERIDERTATRPRHHRHEGRRRRHARGAEGAEGRRRAEGHERHRRDDRRRRGCRRAAERRARGAGRRRRRGRRRRSGSRTARAIRSCAVTARRGSDRMGSCASRARRRTRRRSSARTSAHGAMFEAARILNAFREKLAGEQHLTFNPGVMLGGTAVDFDPVQVRGTAFGKTNVVAEHAVVVRRSARAVARAARQGEEDDAEIVGGLARRRLSATITFDDGYPPMAPTDGNAKLLAMYDQRQPRPRLRAGDGGEPRSRPAPPTSRSSPAR